MRRSRLASAVALVVLASGLTSTTPAVAQAPPEPRTQAVVDEPSVARDPGSPTAPERDLDQWDPLAADSDLVELEELRTEASRTYEGPDGSRQTVLTSGPLNYEAADGSWEEIDARWLADEARGGGGWTNGANSFDARLPSTLAAPVVVEGNGARIAFTLADAGTGADLASVGGTRGRDGSVTYDVGRGVALRYTGLTTGVKEEVLLDGRDAPRRSTFDVQVEGGELRAVEGGAFAVVGRDGTPLLGIPAPFAVDAAGAEGPARIDLAPAEGEGRYRLTLAGDDAWLDAPDRAWPVAIDPQVTLQGPNLSEDCYISSQNPTGQDCAATVLRVGSEGGVRRNSLIEFPDLYQSIPRNAEHVTAMLRLTAVSHSNPSGAVNMRMYKVTKDWSPAVTWNTTNGSTPWTTAGGDFDTTTPEYNDVPGHTKYIGGSSTGSFLLYAHEIVNDWLESGVNDGLGLTAISGTNSDMVNLRSAQHSTTSEQPALIVRWQYREGMRDASSFEDFRITDRSNLNINYASLNGVVAASELDIRGTGHNLGVTRFYNTRNDDSRRWRWSIGADTWLEELDDGSLIYHQASGEQHLFIKKTSGGYFQPPGLNGKLSRTNADDFTVTFNRSNFKLRFQRNGDLLVPTRAVDRNDNLIQYAYTVNGSGYPEIDTVTDTQDRVLDVTWTSGRITAITDWEGRTASYTWDGDLLEVARDAENADTTYGYDGQDRLQTLTSPEGRLTTIVYSTASDRITAVQRRLDSSTTYQWSFNFLGGTQETIVTDPNLNTVKYTWSYREKVAKIVDGLLHEVTGKFNNNDDATERTNAVSGVSRYFYSEDGNHNLDEIQSPSTGTSSANLSTKLSYNTPTTVAGGTYLPSSQLDPMGSCQAFTYDNKGNLTRTYDGSTVSGSSCTSTGGAKTEMNRNPNGTLANVRDPEGTYTYYSYDPAGNLTGVDHPAPLDDWSYELDELSRVEATVDGEENRTTFTYDDMDRIRQITYGGDDLCTSTATCTTFEYDDDGLLEQRVDGTGTTTFGYDDLGRLREKTLPGGANACAAHGSAMTLDYDGYGNLTESCDAQGTITYSFDDANNMTGLAQPGGTCELPRSGCVVFSYAADNQLQQITYPTDPAFRVQYEYTPGGGDLARVTGRQGAVAKIDVEYTYANSGGSDTALVHTRTDNIAGNVRTYKYDNRNRLCWTRVSSSTSTAAACNAPPASSTSYTYDLNGNRTTVNTGGTVVNYHFDDANQLCWFGSGTSSTCTAPAGATTLDYDENGALTDRSDGFESSYNAKLQTSSVEQPGWTSPISMAYSDVDSTERTEYGGTTFDNGMLGLARATTGGHTKTWTRTNDGMLVSQHGTDPAHSTARHYYVLDRQGSVMGLVDPDGEVVNKYLYTPNGAVSSGTVQNGPTNPWRFHGGYRDHDRSIKFGTRYYDPTLNRFTQVDPLAGSISDPSTANRYHYAHNDAANRADPTGYKTWDLGVDVCVYVCVEAGVSWDDEGNVSPYAGGGAGTPGGGVSLTQSGGTVDDQDSASVSCDVGPVTVGASNEEPYEWDMEFGVNSGTGLGCSAGSRWTW